MKATEYDFNLPINEEQRLGLRRWLSAAIVIYGGQAAVASALGVTSSNVDYWRKEAKYVPAWAVLSIWLACPVDGRDRLMEAWRQDVAQWPASVEAPRGSTFQNEACDVVKAIGTALTEYPTASTSRRVELAHKVHKESSEMVRVAEIEAEAGGVN